ncbi:MAG: hypothetical protein ACI4Q0_08740 [Oligosphaeraceae bacterium]
MDFIIRHYEKLILVICLLLLLLSLKYVSSSQAKTAQETREARQEAKTAVRCDTLLEELGDETFKPLENVLNAPEILVDITHSPNGGWGGGLLDGGNVVVCKNRKCGYILPYSVNVCPVCNTEQEKIGPEMPADHDLDQDGIPDLFEKETTYLHYRFRFDAMYDQDQDGFLNLEEYRAGTDPEDPQSTPPLAYLLRVEMCAQVNLPITFNRMKGEGDTAKASFSVAGNPRAVDVKPGAEIRGLDGFTLTKVTPEAATISRGDETYEMHPGEKVKRFGYTTRLLYLGNHVFGARVIPVTVDKLNEIAERALSADANSSQRMGNMGNMGARQQMGGQQMGGGQETMGMADPQLSFDVTPGDVFALVKSPVNAQGNMGGMGGMGNASAYDEEAQTTVEYYQVQPLGDPEKEGGAPVVSVLPVDAAGNPLPNAEPIRLVEKDTIRYNPYSSPSDPPNHDYQAPMLNGAGGGMGGMGMGGQR